MGLMELHVNRALTTTQREAEIGKARGSFNTQEDPGNMQLVMQKQTGALCCLTFLRSLQGLPRLL